METPRTNGRVDVIVNRLANRLADGSPILSAIRSAASTHGNVTVHETRSLGDLTAAVHDIHARGTSCVLLAGGDGSYLAGTTALAHAFGEALPRIGFAPGGTVSTVLRNWGYHGDAALYARRLVDRVAEGTASSVRHPTLRVRDDHGGDYVGFIFGAGLVSHFFDAYYEAPTQGYRAAAAIVARIFASSLTGGELARRVLSPTPCRLIVDGEPQSPKAWSLIAASVVKDLGLHMWLLHRAAESSLAFHAVASALPAHRLGPQMPRVLRGVRLTGEGHVDALVRELVVERDADASYVLDGERILARRVTVTPGPVIDFVPAPPR